MRLGRCTRIRNSAFDFNFVKTKLLPSTNLTLSLVMIAFISTFNACKDNDDLKPEIPSIASIDPTSGTAGTVVTITGANFSSVLSENSVKFNGKSATVTSATATQLVTSVPLDAGTGRVSLTTLGGTIEGPEFKYFNPATISTISPAEGKMNSVVTISGTNFDPVPANNVVKFNGKNATVTIASTTQLIALVPVSAGAGKVSVTINGIIVNGPDFIYLKTTIVSTLAGSGKQGFNDGTGVIAMFDYPTSMVIDPQDNIFLCDQRNNRIRKITPAGVVTTFAGSGVSGVTDGNWNTAQFSYIRGITIDKNGFFFVCDGDVIRKITPGGQVSTFAGGITGFADGIGLAAQFSSPSSLTIDSQGNLFVADGSSRIRKITPNGVVTTFAGDGSSGFVDGNGTNAKLAPSGIAIDKDGNLFVSESQNFAIRKIAPNGTVTTVAGLGFMGFLDGPISNALFRSCSNIVVDVDGSLLIADTSDSRIRRIKNGFVTTVAGTDNSGFENGDDSVAKLYSPFGIAVNSVGHIFVSELFNYSVRKIVIE